MENNQHNRSFPNLAIGIPSITTLKFRTIELLYLCPRVFFGAFLWEGLSLTESNPRKPSFCFLTGFGDGLGNMIGYFTTSLIVAMLQGKSFNASNEMAKSIFTFCTIFFGLGTMWQFNVNTTHDLGYIFIQGFAYMWLISWVVYVLSSFCFRLLNQAICQILGMKNDIEPAFDMIADDIMAGFSAGCGAAFFMGTAATEYPDNFLKSAYGVYENTYWIPAVLLAGCSTTTGFVLAQLLQNLVLKRTWLDRWEDGHENAMLYDQDDSLKKKSGTPMKNPKSELEINPMQEEL